MIINILHVIPEHRLTLAVAPIAGESVEQLLKRVCVTDMTYIEIRAIPEPTTVAATVEGVKP